jgi:hypothetical protein
LLELKYNQILLPLSNLIIANNQNNYLSFDALLYHQISKELINQIGEYNNSNIILKFNTIYNLLNDVKSEIGGLNFLKYLISNDEYEFNFFISQYSENEFGIFNLKFRNIKK